MFKHIFAMCLLLGCPTLLHASTYNYGEQGHNFGGAESDVLNPAHFAGPHALLSVDGEEHFYNQNGDLVRVETDDSLENTQNTYTVTRKLQEVNQGGAITRFFITATGEKVATIHPDGRRETTPSGHLQFTNDRPRYQYGGEVRTSDRDNSLWVSVQDHIGSIVATVDSTMLLEKIDRHPFGGIAYHTMGDMHGGYNDRGFHGYEEEGPYTYFPARHLNKNHGRFIQADSVIPHGDVHGHNRYGYTRGNPINRIDPSGHSDMWPRVQAAETNMCAPQCHLDNYYASPDRIGEVDQALAGPINSYLAGEASFGMYDLYVAGTGNDHLARDYGMPLWARGLSLAGALPVVPNFTRVFRGFGVKNADQLNAIARGDELIPQSFDSSEEWLAAVEKLTDAGWSLDDIAKSHKVGSSFHRGGDGYGLGFSWSTDPRVGFEFYYRRITSSHGSILVSAEVDLASDALVDMRGLRYDPMSRDFVPIWGGRSSEAEVTLFSPLRNYRIEKMGTFRQNEISGDWWEQTINSNEIYNRLDFVD